MTPLSSADSLCQRSTDSITLHCRLCAHTFARWCGWRPRLRTTRPNGSNDEAPSIWLHQRAAALVQRTEGLVARHGGEQLVKVPLTFGLRRLLHLEQVHVMHHAAVDADLTVLGEEVVDRSGAHLLHDLRCLVSADGLDRLQIMHGGRIETGLDHGGHVADLLVKTL